MNPSIAVGATAKEVAPVATRTPDKLGLGLLVALVVGSFCVDGDVDQLDGSNGYAIGADGPISFDRNEGLVVGYARAFSERLRSTAAFGVNRGAECGGGRQPPPA